MGLLVFFPPQQDHFLKTNAPVPYPDYYVAWDLTEQRQEMIIEQFFYSVLKYICGITVLRKTKHLAQNWEKCKLASLSLTPHDKRNWVCESCQQYLYSSFSTAMSITFIHLKIELGYRKNFS